MTGESTIRIALVYPELLGTYGDGGNAMVLARRLRWRRLPVEVVPVPAGEPVPQGCDIYLLGGGEDEPQVLAAVGLRRDRSLDRAAAAGAVILAVCAGYQVLGHTFPGADGALHDGLGLLDVETRRSFDPPDQPVPPRAVGDLVVDPDRTLGLPVLLGYENHGGRTARVRGGRGRPLGTVRSGVGNGTPDRSDGVIDGRVVATYLHGPVLAQNPAFADLLLTWVHGGLPVLHGPAEAQILRKARMRALDVA